MNTTIVEMVTYHLKADISKKQIEATHDSVNSFLKQQDGFLYRSLSQDENNLWVDICYWKNINLAKSASDAFMTSSAGQSLIDLCDMESVIMRHMPVSTEAMSDCSEPA
mgnify:CR=1 FL=1